MTLQGREDVDAAISAGLTSDGLVPREPPHDRRRAKCYEPEVPCPLDLQNAGPMVAIMHLSFAR